MPVPSAVMRVAICSELMSLSKRARSTFRTLPRSGRIAWNLRSRPLLGGAAGGVTLDDVDLAQRGSFSWQSASLPAGRRRRARPCGGSSRGPCGRLRGRARLRRSCRRWSWRRAGSRAGTPRAFATTLFDRRAAGETSFILVWLANLSGILTDSTQARPSRMSSPVTSTLAFLAISFSSMYLLMTGSSPRAGR